MADSSVRAVASFTPVEPGDPNNASLLFIKPIPYSSDGEDTTAPTNYVVKRLRYIFNGVPLEKGDVVQDSSTLELHKAQFVVYAQIQLGNDKPGKFKKVNRQWLEEVFGDSPDSNLVDDFLQKNYDKTHRRDSRGGHTHDSLPGQLLPFEVDARQIHAIRWKGRLTAKFGEVEKTVPLTHAWVADNFEERYLQELKVVAATKKKFTMGPTGDCLDSSTLPSELELECAPKVRYQQGDKDL